MLARIHRRSSLLFKAITVILSFGLPVRGLSFGFQRHGARGATALALLVSLGQPNPVQGKWFNAFVCSLFGKKCAYWSQIAEFLGDARLESLGTAVAMSYDGNVIAMSAPHSTSSGIPGYVRVYRFQSDSFSAASPSKGGTWVQLGQDIVSEVANNLFGSAIALSGDGLTLAVGAYLHNTTLEAAGLARVYEYNGVAWNQIGDDFTGKAARDRYGKSVDLDYSGLNFVASAYLNDDFDTNAGLVQVFSFDGLSWNQTGGDILGTKIRENFGYSVAMSYDAQTIAVGGVFGDGPVAGSFTGNVGTYANVGGAWQQQTSSKIGGEGQEDLFGHSVDLGFNGTYLAVGAPNNGGNGLSAGHVRGFQLTGTAPNQFWNQLGQDMDGEAASNELGYSVAISSDGLTIVGGARYSDSAAGNAGAARAFSFDGTNWVQKGQTITGEAAVNDYFGTSVDMNYDGNVIIVGAPGNNLNGDDAGLVRVYRYLGA